MRNFSNKNYWKWTWYEEDTSRRSLLFSEKSRILNFKLLPKIQNNLYWHENFTTITRLQGEENKTNIIEFGPWMKEIQAPEVAALKCSFWTQLEPENFDWLPKTHYVVNWSENFTTQTRRRCATFPTNFIKFRPWMQKLQHFEVTAFQEGMENVRSDVQGLRPNNFHNFWLNG